MTSTENPITRTRRRPLAALLLTAAVNSPAWPPGLIAGSLVSRLGAEPLSARGVEMELQWWRRWRHQRGGIDLSRGQRPNDRLLSRGDA